MGFFSAIRNLDVNDQDPSACESFCSLAKKNSDNSLPFYLLTFVQVGEAWHPRDGVAFHAEQSPLPYKQFLIDLLGFKEDFKALRIYDVQSIAIDSGVLAGAFKVPQEENETRLEQMIQLDLIEQALQTRIDESASQEARDELTGLQTRISSSIKKLFPFLDADHARNEFKYISYKYHLN